MVKDIQSELRAFDSRRHFVAAAIVFLTLIIVGYTLVWWSQSQPPAVSTQYTSQTSITESSLMPDGLHASASEPTVIRIPKLALEASFESPVGLWSNGEVGVPDGYDTVARYKHAPTPGEYGPAVVLGHVDSKTSPAVFFSLGQLTRGDEIVIDRADGSSVVFVVTELVRPEQDAFPTEAVYGDINHAGLRLVTCSGDYDRGTGRYSHNLIVFGTLATVTLAFAADMS